MARILVVEDDADLLFLYQAALAPAGYDIVQADSGQAAMSALGQGVFDAILLDLNMPDAHGSEVVAALRQDARHASVPVVIITANDHWVSDELAGSVQGVLVKPISMMEMVRLVDGLLSRSP